MSFCGLTAHFFLLLNNIPLNGCTTVCFAIHPSKDTLVSSIIFHYIYIYTIKSYYIYTLRFMYSTTHKLHLNTHLLNIIIFCSHWLRKMVNIKRKGSYRQKGLIWCYLCKIIYTYALHLQMTSKLWVTIYESPLCTPSIVLSTFQYHLILTT